MSTSVITQAGERRSARIESLRALAALGVLVGHAYGWSHGWSATVYATYVGRLLLSGGFGVFLFFALSGYLLYLPFARAAFAGAGAVDVRRYARNRALRVLPLYYVVVATYLAVNHDALRAQWWRFALFAESLSPRTVARVDGPVWSLVVEVQFYVLLPVFAWALAALSRRRVTVAAAVVGVGAAAALALRVVTVTAAAAPSAVWRYSLPATCVFFAPGLLLALWRVALDRRRPGWLAVPLLGSSSVWLAAGAGLWLVVAYRYTWDALMLIAAALLLGGCALPLRSGVAVRVLDGRVLAALGTASYSLYLWHEPIVGALARAAWMPRGFGAVLVVGAVASIAVAVVSYRVVEAPFLRLRRAWSPGREAALPAECGDPSLASGHVAHSVPAGS